MARVAQVTFHARTAAACICGEIIPWYVPGDPLLGRKLKHFSERHPRRWRLGRIR